MMRKGIKRLVVSHYVLVVLLTLVLVESVFIYSVRTFYYNSIFNNLNNHAQVSASFYNKFHSDLNVLTFDKQLPDVTESFAHPSAELQVITKQGTVLATTSGFDVREQIKTRDVTAAAQGTSGRWIGTNDPTGERIMAVATPLLWNGQPIAVLRYITSLQEVDRVIRNISGIALLIGFAILGAVSLVSLALANSIVRPVNRITAASALMAKGRFDVRVDESYRYELGDLAKTLNFMAQEIVKSDKLKNDFISSISHELRTPLTSIKGWSETILSGDLEDKDETKTGLRIISKETDRLVGLVEELLDFSRLEQKQLSLDIGQVDMEYLLNEVMLQMAAKARSKRVSFQYVRKGEASPPSIPGDPNRLKQVFLNIADNAVKFADPDTAITVTASVEPDALAVSIRDIGASIPMEHLSKITEKFYQVNPQGEGTGLGLAICKEIVELHGGKLAVSSSDTEGTAVTVRLPLS
ncbi:sensor histidine kinase [Paenibacillus sp. H1-7]|uniref:sensor histidine kinase n=1 Tax=Paenibacillus sp. H1-7 TaxID=2282849 RepID=UPI001EF953FA|nr:HAMP domain-containing sensor histidine kinase [Paenibacillus sp. H1-7]ULL14703.1 sensor histidine kinase [Paenibacillus sp. H1-7]